MADFKKGEVNFDVSNLSAFGTLETAELTPVIQGDFVYGLNVQIWNTPTVSGAGATVDTSASRLRIQSGTNSAGYAYITSKKPARYRAGQGTVARFTPLFTSGSASNIQLWGMGSITANAPYDGYFFGYNGASFGIAHYIAGTPAWYTQASDWNGDKCNGSAGTSFTYRPDTGVPVMIKYPYLGFGNIEFFIQNPTTARWVLVHTIRYANTTTVAELSNPTLQFMGFTLNSGNTSNKIMYCASVGVFISGAREFVGNPKWAIDNSKGTVTTETNLLTLKNCATYNGVTNRGLIRLNNLSYASSAASGNAAIRLKLTASLGGAPSYTPISGNTVDAGVTITGGNSIASYDVAGTTISSGSYIFGTTLDNPNSNDINLIPYDIYIQPGETLTISGFSTISSTMGVTICWSEDT